MDTAVVMTRLQRLDGYQRKLRQLAQMPLEEYLGDDFAQSLVERWLQLSIQMCINTANYIIAQYGLRAPDELENLFGALGREEMIPMDLAHALRWMIGCRNILVHCYLDVDHRKVHEILCTRLDDFDRFARAIVALMENTDWQD